MLFLILETPTLGEAPCPGTVGDLHSKSDRCVTVKGIVIGTIVHQPDALNSLQPVPAL